jgi:class 3 adenylate cyclase/tetratricopeptide (TPR) repeat protein
LREERRVVTAMFADVVGSTALTEHMDPEDARDLLGGVIGRVVNAVEAYGGTVKDLAGDGVLAFFGAPTAHEDDEERAVLAALRLLAEVEDYRSALAEPDAVLAVRIGIDTGEAVLGPVGASSRIEYGAVGDVVNTAARLQGRAPAGSALVSSRTRKAVEALFRWGYTDSYRLTGKSEPVVASPVLGRVESPGAGMVGSSSGAGPTIGRRVEQRFVRSLIDQVVDDRGAVLFISGVPGIGKSQLLDEARNMLRIAAGQRGAWLEGRCASLDSSTPLAPFRAVLRQVFDLPSTAAGDAARDTSARVAMQAATLLGKDYARHAPFLFRLLQLPGGTVDETAQMSTLDPEAVQRGLFQAVVAVVEAFAAQAPTVLAVEDLHWADASSLLLAEQILELTRRSRLIVIITLRLEVDGPAWRFKETWTGRDTGRAYELPLQALAPEDADLLLRSFVRGDVLPPNTKTEVLSAAEGNPFFLHEVVRSLQDSGALTEKDGVVVFDHAVEVEVPETVERVILARTDRLDDVAHELMAAASVIGRKFSLPVLERTSEHGEAACAALPHLCRLQLVERLDVQTYDFSHALIQQTMYRSLLRRTRRRLHERVATALSSLYDPDDPEVARELGHHFSAAELPERAIPHLRLAADRAAATFANQEALVLHRESLSQLRILVQRGDERAVEAIVDTLQRYGEICHLVGEYDAALAALKEAVSMAPISMPTTRSRLWRLIGQTFQVQRRHDEARDAFEKAAAALGADDSAPEWWEEWIGLTFARVNLAYMELDLVEHERLIAELRPAVEVHASAKQRADFYSLAAALAYRQTRYRLPPSVADDVRAGLAAAEQTGDAAAIAWSWFHLGFSLLWSDRPSDAQEHLGEALTLARSSGDRLLESRAAAYLVVAARLRGDVERVRASLPSSEAAAEAAGMVEYEAVNRACRSWLAWRSGHHEEASQEAEAALAAWHSIPSAYPFCWLALWPLLALATCDGRTEQAIGYASELLAGDQQPPPPAISAKLLAAQSHWARQDETRTRARFEEAVAEARASGYL